MRLSRRTEHPAEVLDCFFFETHSRLMEVNFTDKNMLNIEFLIMTIFVLNKLMTLILQSLTFNDEVINY